MRLAADREGTAAHRAVPKGWSPFGRSMRSVSAVWAAGALGSAPGRWQTKFERWTSVSPSPATDDRDHERAGPRPTAAHRRRGDQPRRCDQGQRGVPPAPAEVSISVAAGKAVAARREPLAVVSGDDGMTTVDGKHGGVRCLHRCRSAGCGRSGDCDALPPARHGSTVNPRAHSSKRHMGDRWRGVRLRHRKSEQQRHVAPGELGDRTGGGATTWAQQRPAGRQAADHRRSMGPHRGPHRQPWGTVVAAGNASRARTRGRRFRQLRGGETFEAAPPGGHGGVGGGPEDVERTRRLSKARP
jgi:hypothetical protein